MALFMSIMGTALPTLLIFPQERPVFLREYSTNHYSVFAYFMSRFGVEAFVTAIQVFITAILTYYLIGFKVSPSRVLLASFVDIGSFCH